MFPAWEFDHLPNEWWGTVVSDHDWKTRRVQGSQIIIAGSCVIPTTNVCLKDFLHFLWTCPYDSILVVGHACFLKQLLHGDKPKKMLGNCEGVITIMKNGKLKVIKEIKPDHN